MEAGGTLGRTARGRLVGLSFVRLGQRRQGRKRERGEAGTKHKEYMIEVDSSSNGTMDDADQPAASSAHKERSQCALARPMERSEDGQNV